MSTNILFISENYYLKSSPPGEYINSPYPLPRKLGLKLLQLPTEKLYLHKCNRELALVNSGNTGAFINKLILNLNLKLVWLLSLLHLVMLRQILLLKLSYLTNNFSLFFKLIIISSHPAQNNFLFEHRPSFYNCKC